MSDFQLWLMLINSVSGENNTARMRIWRALKASGAAALRDGVYLLPKSEGAQAVFSEQAREVTATGGTAHILTTSAEDQTQQLAFVRLFERSKDYAALLTKLNVLRRGMARIDESEARRQLAVLRRDIANLGAIDFFPDASRGQVESALADAEAALNARIAPDEPHAARGRIPKRDKARYQSRTWATREKLWIDRVASAWLIRRFIDPKAKFRWLKKPRD
jgi:DNA-binding transcriptional regulator PaaX